MNVPKKGFPSDPAQGSGAMMAQTTIVAPEDDQENNRGAEAKDILVRDGDMKFSKPIARAVLRDSRLSFGARGLFIFLWDLPIGWRPRVAHLATMGPERRDAIRSRFSELQRVGAMRIEPLRTDDGKVAGRQWVMINPGKWAITAPLSNSTTKTPELVSRKSEDPTVGKSTEKVHLSDASAMEAEEGLSHSSDHSQRKRRRKRPSGLVTWCDDDELEAKRIEAQYALEAITSAIKLTLRAGRHPVPGIVSIYLEQQEQQAKVATASLLQLQLSESQFQQKMQSDDRVTKTGRRLLESIKTRGATKK